MKTILSLLSILLISNITIAQTTAIPDANFEAKLINLGYDSYPIDGTVPTANINTITSLDINGIGILPHITNLSGIEDFTSLQTLICYHQHLTTLDLTSNIALTNLVCYSNQLTNLNLDSNIALNSLNCWANQLTSLDVTNNVNLTTLMCGHNQLTSLNLTNNTSLDYLSCGQNQLTGLNVTNNTALTFLTISENLISNIDVTNLSALSLLDCENNLITTLDLSSNTHLGLLECRLNQLTSLNMANGNNTNVSNVNFEASNNPLLTCIQVDNVAYSTTNWTTIDAGASFSTNCNYPCITATGMDSRTACNSLTWIDGNTYTSTNNIATYNIVNGAANGCDSVITLNLTINSVDSSVTQTVNVLTANETGATYKWLDCNNGNAIIPSQTNQTFTATSNGSYAVQVTKNGCIDTSSCYTVTGVGVYEIQSSSISIYPNPTSGKVIISLEKGTSTSITLRNSLGQQLVSKRFNKNQIEVDLSAYPNGIYFLQLEINGELITKKVLKK